MSAFIVDKVHIDLLVGLAQDGPRDNAEGSWTRRGWGRPPRFLSHAELGLLLARANVKSVRARYPDDDDMIPDWYDGDRYSWTDPGYRLSVAEGAKAIACFDYQACEDDGWSKSRARKLLTWLERQLLAVMPIRTDLPWAWTDETVRTLQEASR